MMKQRVYNRRDAIRPLARSLLLPAVLSLWWAGAAPGQMPPENIRCMNCHGSETILRSTPEDRATMVDAVPGVEPRQDPTELYILPQEYDYSVHRQTMCIECHPDCKELPHPIETARATCRHCHAQE